MSVAILVISALSLVVQLAIAASAFIAVRGLYKGLKTPLSPQKPPQPAQTQKPNMRLVGSEE